MVYLGKSMFVLCVFMEMGRVS